MPVPEWNAINKADLSALIDMEKEVEKAIVDNKAVLKEVEHVRQHLDGLDDEEIIARLKGWKLDDVKKMLKCKSNGQRASRLRDIAGDIRVDTLESRMKLRVLEFKIKIRKDVRQWENIKDRIKNIKTEGLTVKKIWKALAMGVAFREFWEILHTDWSALHHLPVIRHIWPPSHKKNNKNNKHKRRNH